jgi:hypothetical protein
MKRCQQCGTEYPDTQLFCDLDGRALTKKLLHPLPSPEPQPPHPQVAFILISLAALVAVGLVLFNYNLLGRPNSSIRATAVAKSPTPIAHLPPTSEGIGTYLLGSTPRNTPISTPAGSEASSTNEASTHAIATATISPTASPTSTPVEANISELQRSVERALSLAGYTKIKVRVSDNGEVVVFGNVDSVEDSEKIGTAIDRTPGTRRVIGYLQIPRGYLGVRLSGTVIDYVDPLGAAERYGFKAGDRIAALESKPIRRAKDYDNAMKGESAGQYLAVTVLRGSARLNLTARLAKSPPDMVTLPAAESHR